MSGRGRTLPPGTGSFRAGWVSSSRPAAIRKSGAHTHPAWFGQKRPVNTSSRMATPPPFGLQVAPPLQST